ncbi:MAG: PadR family transcriptional regulator [Anaerolineaceae bacterium]|nr:PadR family transcriptional regulator [Anaerolineaceae bacterium]
MTENNFNLSATEYALLGFLYHKPVHGYELHKQITDPDSVGMIWGLKLSNMYAQLDKLDRMGLITGKLQSNEQRPARMEYALTAQGKSLFNGWLFEPVKHPREFRHEFMVKLYFLQQYQPDRVTTLLDTQLAECQRWLETTQEKMSRETGPASFQTEIYQFRISQIQSMIDWIQWLKRQITNE